MYEYIFESKVITILFGLCITLTSFVAISGFRNGCGDTLRFFSFSFPPIFGLGFLSSALFSDNNINKIDLLSCIVFEYVVFLVQIVIFIKIKSYVIYGLEFSRKAKLYIFIMFVFLLVVNFHILDPLASTSERLDYLGDSPFNKYITYLSILFVFVMSIVVAGYINKIRRVTPFVLFGFLCVFIFSLLTGSKGAFFLFSLQVLSLINYRRYHVSFHRLFIAGGIGALLLFITGFYISQRSGIDFQEFISLVTSRFFLSNDARALAFDYRYLSDHPSTSEFIVHSFRSIAALAGFSQTDPPLGQLLFDYLYNHSSSTGANTSISALIVYYSKEGQAFFSVLLLLGIIIPAIFLMCLSINFIKSTNQKVCMFASLNLCLALLIQDFLSFQLVIVIFSSVYLFLFINRVCGVDALRTASWRQNEHSNDNNPKL